MARYHGRRGRLYASVNGTSAAVPVASLTNWTLNTATDRIEVTAFGDPNKVYLQGLGDLTGDFTGFWDDTDSTLRQASTSSDGTKLYLYPSTDASSRYAFGPAWVDVSYDVPVGGAVGMSGSFAANGAWTNGI